QVAREMATRFTRGACGGAILSRPSRRRPQVNHFRSRVNFRMHRERPMKRREPEALRDANPTRGRGLVILNARRWLTWLSDRTVAMLEPGPRNFQKAARGAIPSAS